MLSLEMINDAEYQTAIESIDGALLQRLKG